MGTGPGILERKTLQRLRDDGGQGIAEYGIALAIISVVCVSAAMAISTNVQIMWTRAMQTIILTVLGV